jgi:hypothetical protein
MAFVYVKGKEIRTSELRKAQSQAMPEAFKGNKFGKLGNLKRRK